MTELLRYVGASNVDDELRTRVLASDVDRAFTGAKTEVSFLGLVWRELEEGWVTYDATIGGWLRTRDWSVETADVRLWTALAGVVYFVDAGNRLRSKIGPDSASCYAPNLAQLVPAGKHLVGVHSTGLITMWNRQLEEVWTSESGRRPPLPLLLVRVEQPLRYVGSEAEIGERADRWSRNAAGLLSFTRGSQLHIWRPGQSEEHTFEGEAEQVYTLTAGSLIQVSGSWYLHLEGDTTPVVLGGGALVAASASRFWLETDSTKDIYHLCPLPERVVVVHLQHQKEATAASRLAIADQRWDVRFDDELIVTTHPTLSDTWWIVFGALRLQLSHDGSVHEVSQELQQAGDLWLGTRLVGTQWEVVFYRGDTIDHLDMAKPVFLDDFDVKPEHYSLVVGEVPGWVYGTYPMAYAAIHPHWRANQTRLYWIGSSNQHTLLGRFDKIGPLFTLSTIQSSPFRLEVSTADCSCILWQDTAGKFGPPLRDPQSESGWVAGRVDEALHLINPRNQVVKKIPLPPSAQWTLKIGGTWWTPQPWVATVSRYRCSVHFANGSSRVGSHQIELGKLEVCYVNAGDNSLVLTLADGGSRTAQVKVIDGYPEMVLDPEVPEERITMEEISESEEETTPELY